MHDRLVSRRIDALHQYFLVFHFLRYKCKDSGFQHEKSSGVRSLFMRTKKQKQTVVLP